MQKYKLVTLSEELFRKTQAAWEKERLLIVLTNVRTNEGGYRTHILPPLRVMNARREYCYNRNNVINWQDKIFKKPLHVGHDISSPELRSLGNLF